MANLIIDWDNHSSPSSEIKIIDIYPTNLIEIPLDEYDLAEFAYYEGLSSILSDNNTSPSSARNR